MLVFVRVRQVPQQLMTPSKQQSQDDSLVDNTSPIPTAGIDVLFIVQ